MACIHPKRSETLTPAVTPLTSAEIVSESYSPTLRISRGILAIDDGLPQK